MSAIGDKLWNIGVSAMRLEVKVTSEQAGTYRGPSPIVSGHSRADLDAWVATVERVIATQLARGGFNYVWQDVIKDCARNAVAALQPDLARDAGLPREAAGVDFDTNLISGRAR